MKILHLIDSGGMYGAEAVLIRLMCEQKARGVRPILGSIRLPEMGQKDLEVVAEREGINVKTFRTAKGPNVAGALRIARWIGEERIDLVHCHGYKANILMGLLPKAIRKVPYVVTMHGWTSRKMLSKLRLYEWADVVMARRANCAVVVCDAMRNHPRIRAARLQVRVVHNGIDEIRYHHNDSNGFGGLGVTRHQDNTIIGSVGRLSPEKGFDSLIRAVARVIQGGHHVQLVVIGDGPDRARLERIARDTGVAEYVHFTGYVGQASQFIRNFDVFVLSSLSEGLPITLLEAMQSGVPVIATRVGGIPEALDGGRCGILVNPGNEHELGRAVIAVHGSAELRRQISMAAKERVTNEYSSEKMEEGYRKLYEQVLSIE